MIRKKGSILTVLFFLLCGVVLLAVFIMTLALLFGLSGIDSFTHRGDAAKHLCLTGLFRTQLLFLELNMKKSFLFVVVSALLAIAALLSFIQFVFGLRQPLPDYLNLREDDDQDDFQTFRKRFYFPQRYHIRVFTILISLTIFTALVPALHYLAVILLMETPSCLDRGEASLIQLVAFLSVGELATSASSFYMLKRVIERSEGQEGRVKSQFEMEMRRIAVEGPAMRKKNSNEPMVGRGGAARGEGRDLRRENPDDQGEELLTLDS
jgi:hypothetical protein